MRFRNSYNYHTYLPASKIIFSKFLRDTEDFAMLYSNFLKSITISATNIYERFIYHSQSVSTSSRKFVFVLAGEIASFGLWIVTVYETAECFYSRLHDPRRHSGIHHRRLESTGL